MKKLLIGVVLISNSIFAQEIPSLFNSDSLLNPEPVSMNAKEIEGLRLAERWINSDNNKPVIGANGSVTYLYGAGMPAVVCAPLKICDIALQEGETIRNVDLGDTVRWKVSLAVSGTDDNPTSHVVLKPTDAGLDTNILITTDRRAYNLTLKSAAKGYMSSISFAYSSDITQELQNYHARVTKKLSDNRAPTGEQVSDLDFEYNITGNANWKPLRVYNNGIKTVIQMPKSMRHREAPVLLAIGADKQEQIVNYRLVDDKFIVDLLFAKAILISGVGSNQQRIVITHK